MGKGVLPFEVDKGHVALFGLLLLSVGVNAALLFHVSNEEKKHKTTKQQPETTPAIQEEEETQPKEQQQQQQQEEEEESQQEVMVVTMRHGKRIDDVEPSWTGTAERPYDPPIVEPEMATRAAKQLHAFGIEIDEIISSPFLRCIQTAHACADVFGIDNIRIDNGVSEMMTPRNVCEPPKFDEKQMKATTTKALTHSTVTLPEWPETLEAALRRFTQATIRIAKQKQKQASQKGVLIVAHGGTVANFVANTQSVGFEDVYETAYCSWAKATWTEFGWCEAFSESVGILQ